MDDTVDEVSINSATTINRLECLVQESDWESVLAHLETRQGREDARMRNSTTGKLLYHILEFYNHTPFHVIEALVKAYPDHSFICTTPKSKQPLYHMSSKLPALVANFIECPLDWTKNECKMQMESLLVSFYTILLKHCCRQIMDLIVTQIPHQVVM